MGRIHCRRAVRNAVSVAFLVSLTALYLASGQGAGGAVPPTEVDLHATARPSENGSRLVRFEPVSERQSDLAVYSVSMGREITVRVIRPADTSVPRPSLYLLGGVEGSSDERGWSEETDMVEFVADKNVNVVVPYGGASSYYTDWERDDPVLGRNKWTTFLTEELPPVIDSALGTTTKNAIAGLSMSGTAVLSLAIAAPGLYQAVGSYSGCAMTSDPLGSAYVTAAVVNNAGNPVNMWGPVGGPGWVAHDPYLNAARLRGTPLYISNGSGVPGPHDRLDDPSVDGDPNSLAAQVVRGGPIEAATGQCTERLAARLRDLQIPATVNLRPTGTHSWGYWQDELHQSWPMLAAAIAA